MRLQEIKKAIEESRREGGITALEEYDRTRKLAFRKEVVAFTMRHDIINEFRKHHKKDMSKIVEKLVSNYLKKES